MAHEGSRAPSWLWKARDACVLLTLPSKLVPSMLSLSQPDSITSHSPASDVAPKHPM